MVPKAYMYKGGKWEYVGEVLAQAAPTPRKQFVGDRFFPAGEYDYVFDVDIADGAVKPQMPYNEGDNPMVVAEKFLAREQLNPQYKTQIMDFIKKNTRGGGSGKPKPKAEAPKEATVFPMRETQFYDKTDMDGLSKKIEEFHQALHKAGDPASFTENEFKYINSLIVKLRDPKLYSYVKEFSSFEVEVAKKLIRWPAANFVPVMDLWRVIVLHHASQNFFSGLDSGLTIISGLVGKLKSGPGVLWKIFPKLLSNLFIHTSNTLALVRAKDIIAEGFKLLDRQDTAVCGLYANYLMNCSSNIDLVPSVTDEYVTDCIHQAGDLVMNAHLDAESTLKLAISLGNFATLRPSVVQEAVSYMPEIISKLADSPDPTTKSIVESMRILVKS